MNNLLKDKNILIMGVANKWSIAWAIAEQSYRAGAKLSFSYYGEKSLRSLEKLTEGMKDVVFVECDVTKDQDIENTFNMLKERVGVIHGIAHCIAHAKTEELKGKFMDTSRDGYAMAHDISVYSLISISKYAKPLMTEGGSIITLTYYGGEKVIPNYNVMGVAKAALDASVKYLAVDLGKDNIRVNNISAGPIRTLAGKGISHFDQMLKAFEEKSPMGRLVDPAEVGKTALFLFSDLSSGVTGETIHVDCGYNVIGI
ncbi:MAG: SDR family oxidoreductase [Clostridiales bacterium]|nr:SDR family oxidoreductase [Clostridiales bacterium]